MDFNSIVYPAPEPTSDVNFFLESEDPEIDLEATDKRINLPNRTLANRTMQAQASFAQREAKVLHNAAMEEDPNIFDYDGVYDDIKATTAQSHPLNRSAADAPVCTIKTC